MKDGWLHVPAEILESEDLTLLEKCILGKVDSFKNRNCTISNAMFAKMFSCHRTTIVRAIDDLIERKILQKSLLPNGRILKISSSTVLPLKPSSSTVHESSSTVHKSSSTVLPKNTIEYNRVHKTLKKENAPKTAPSKKEKSIFKKAQLLMEEIHGETYLNYKKEAPCLKKFIEQIAKKHRADPWQLIESMIYQFAEMKQTDRTVKGYWRDMDFTPSKLVAHAEAVYERLKQRTKEEKISEEDRALIKRMFGKGT